MRPAVDLDDALAGIARFNSLSPPSACLHWLGAAGPAAPADAWAAFKRAADAAAPESL
jgi:hypothetical protein